LLYLDKPVFLCLMTNSSYIWHKSERISHCNTLLAVFSM